MRHESEFPMVNAIVKVSQRVTPHHNHFSPVSLRLLGGFFKSLFEQETRQLFWLELHFTALGGHVEPFFLSLGNFTLTSQTRMSPENFHTMNEPRACEFKSFIDERRELCCGEAREHASEKHLRAFLSLSEIFLTRNEMKSLFRARWCWC
jgi:hypothetical protein